jgi:hypothetical protein
VTETEGRERLVLTFSPLPQDALSVERDVADGEAVLRALRSWGEHLARAIRTADRLAAHGWRLTLMGDQVMAEKHSSRAELAALAKQLRDDLRALTASAAGDGDDPSYLSLHGDDVRSAEPDDFRPLIDS